ncbi:MAG: MFS transporter, partial [Gammaproteobacteria bacterium]
MSEAPGEVPAARALPTRGVAAYGAGAGVFEMIRAPGLAILPALYAKDFGFALTTLSLAMFWLRLSDAVMDPLVGYLSDRTRTRWGSRKPWIVASIFVLVPACYLLYVPGESPTLWQFVIAYFLYFLGRAMFDIPYTAWGAEIARSYEERSRLSVARNFFTNLGLLTISLIPLLPWMSSTSMNFEVTAFIAALMAILFPAVVVAMVVTVPGVTMLSTHAAVSIGETLRAIRGNPPLLIFLGAAFLSDLAMGAAGAMFFIFFDTYLGIGEFFTLIFVTAIAVSTASLRVWQSVVRRHSKQTLLVLCLVLGAAQGAAILLLEPGEWALPLYIGFLSLYYVTAVGREVALYSMIGDIVDYDTLKTGANRAGQLSSAWMVLRKLGYALGPVIGMYLAGALGYDPSAAQNDATAIFGLKAANGYLPAILLAAA